VPGMHGIDLNLLSVLGALLEERNVTRAGAKLSLSQPTMSGALARLRQHFGDELLVRSGREYRLTPVASRLLPAVRDALDQVERTLSAPLEFDPATSTRRFSIAVSGPSLLALGGLVRRVRELAPRVRLDMWPVSMPFTETGRDLLGYDLLIAPAGLQPDGQQEVVLRDRFVYVADSANPRLAGGRLTVEDLAALPHAAARPPQAGLVNAALERLGVTPNVIATTGGWLPLPFVVAGTDLVAAVPERLARRVSGAAGVTVAEPPFGTIELTETAWWHPMRATDPALTWLRAILREEAGAHLVPQDSDMVHPAGGRGDHPPDSLDEQGHLIGDEP
jgi:DNA-binding transcriptional LysR family regulator